MEQRQGAVAGQKQELGYLKWSLQSRSADFTEIQWQIQGFFGGPEAY